MKSFSQLKLLQASRYRGWEPALFLFGLAFAALLRTVAPTVYLLDSAEFAIGAPTLGIVHAPGYALYVVAAHIFTQLVPVGDMAFRVNLFSALCLALTIPILFQVLSGVVPSRAVAACTALSFCFTYYVWASGVTAEIYASQLLTVAICLWVLMRMARSADVRGHYVLPLGLAVGIAAAAHPSSGLLAAGLVVACLQLRLRFRDNLLAALIAVMIFVLCQLYFPIRYAAAPELNLAGQFSSDGSFHAVNLGSLSGIVWLLRGGQFTGLFFSNGLLPSVENLRELFMQFWDNYLGLGLLLGCLGLALAIRQRAGWVLAWAVAFLAYSLFYSNYRVLDRDLMFGPVLLLWTFPLAVGLEWVLHRAPSRLRMALLILIPALVFTINFPLVDLSADRSVRTRAEAIVRLLPENTRVFGDWQNIVPIQYLQMVEMQRPDLRLYNVFLFDPIPLNQYLDELLKERKSIVVLSELSMNEFTQTLLLPGSRYHATAVRLPGSATTKSALVGYLIAPADP